MKDMNVYIATLPRSGSTLLGMIMGSHSQVYHIGESSYWGKVDVNRAKCSCGQIGCDFLKKIKSRIKDFDKVESIYKVCAIIDNIQEPGKTYHSMSLLDSKLSNKLGVELLLEDVERAVQGLDILSDSYRYITGKKVIIDNTKVITIAEQVAIKDNWKVLIITRDPRGIAYSNKKAGIRKNVPRPLSSKIPVFIDFAKRAEKLNRNKNVLLVRYEDICANPLLKITEICSFLNLDFNVDMLNFRKYRAHIIMGNRMIFGGNELIVEDMEWRSGLSDSEKELIMKNQELVQLFNNFGYELVS